MVEKQNEPIRSPRTNVQIVEKRGKNHVSQNALGCILDQSILLSESPREYGAGAEMREEIGNRRPPEKRQNKNSFISIEHFNMTFYHP